MGVQPLNAAISSREGIPNELQRLAPGPKICQNEGVAGSWRLPCALRFAVREYCCRLAGGMSTESTHTTYPLLVGVVGVVHPNRPAVHLPPVE